MKWCLAFLAVAACASGPSQRWRDGGVRLLLDAAYFTHGDATIELRPSGDVIEDETLLFRVDRQGRIRDEKGEPVAVLGADGWLVSESDGSLLGWIGPGQALAPDRKAESVRVLPSGEAFASGASTGSWTHCTSAMLLTCTLVTHVVVARDRANAGRDARDALSLIQLLSFVR